MKTVASSSAVSALTRMGRSLVLTAGKKNRDTSKTREVSVSTSCHCFVNVPIKGTFNF